jgi:hypothetical protein
MERTLLDKMVNGAFLGKRKIGRPLKYNIRNKGSLGWVELVFNPTTRVEKTVSTALKFIHPYLFHITYKFHVSQARDVGKYLKQSHSQHTLHPPHSCSLSHQTEGSNVMGVLVCWPVAVCPRLILIYYYRHPR